MPSLINNNIVKNIIKACSALVVCIAGAIGVFYYKADVKVLFAVCAFLIFWVLLPGIWLMERIGIRSNYLSTTISRGFFAGFAANVILFYTSMLIGTDFLLYAAGPAMTIALVYGCVRRGATENLTAIKTAVRSVPSSFYVFVMLVFIYSILTTQFIYISPLAGAFSYLKIDFGFHAGIINSLSVGYPPHDPWVYGRVIEYHFFTEMLYSIPVRIFNLHSEEILMSCTPYIIAAVLPVSVYSFFREFTTRKEKVGLYCLAFHCANMFVLKEFADSWFMYQIYSNINNAGMGLSCILTTIPFLKYWDTGRNTKKINSKEMFVFAVFVMLSTGIKGPMTLVVVGAMTGTLLLAVILRKANKMMFASTGIAIISFTIIYVYILGAQHSNETGGRLINLWEVTDLFFLKPAIMSLTSGSRIAQGALLLGAFTVFYLGAFFVPFILGYARELKLVISGAKDYCFSRVVIYAACLVGFACMMITNFAGHSQVYFGFVSCGMVPIIAFWYFEENCGKESAGYIKKVFAICICCTTLTTCLYICEAGAAAKGVYQSRNENVNKYKNVTPAEYEGLLWLRDNTDKNAIIASDRYYSSKKEEYDLGSRASNTHFMYAVYSGRRQYLEGAGFSFEKDDIEELREMIKTNNKFFDVTDNDRGELARELGIDYVMVSKRFENPGDLRSDDYEECYSNEDVTIYRVKE